MRNAGKAAENSLDPPATHALRLRLMLTGLVCAIEACRNKGYFRFNEAEYTPAMVGKLKVRFESNKPANTRIQGDLPYR